jgi:hypothetical protein
VSQSDRCPPASSPFRGGELFDQERCKAIRPFWIGLETFAHLYRGVDVSACEVKKQLFISRFVIDDGPMQVWRVPMPGLKALRTY